VNLAIKEADGGDTPLSTFDKWTAETPRTSAAARCVNRRLSLPELAVLPSEGI
jgi:hypothetical protein